jgi:hypothetical protein
MALSPATIALGANAVQEPPPRATSPDGLPTRLVLALDGIPYDVFASAQRSGCFQDFKPAARLVSTFPSLTDVAFSAIAGTQPPQGYQVMRFDPERNHVVGDTLRSLSSSAHAHVPADSRPHSSWHRMLSYVASSREAVHDLRTTREDFLHSDKATFVAYVEESDAVLHVHGRAGAEKFLRRVDAFVRDLEDTVRARTGRSLAIDIVSDHGSTMERGHAVPLEADLARCGFRRSQRLLGENDVAYSLAGIIASVAIACAPDRAEAVARCVADDAGVDAVTFMRGEAVVVLARGGEAEVRLVGTQPESYSYRVLRGDPLGLGQLVGITEATPLPADHVVLEEDAFRATSDGPCPDPLRRTWRAFHGAVNEPTQVLVSLGDGYEAGNGAVRFLAALRGRAGTHGSLTRLASLGVFASNWTELHDSSAWDVAAFLFGAEASQAAARAVRADALVRARPPSGAAAPHAPGA